MDLAAVYEEYFPKIYNFFFYKVMHKEITEDLTSIVFLKVAEKLHTYNPEKGAVSTWIYAIAQNALIDYFRTRHIPVSLDEATGDLAVSVSFEEQSSLIENETRRELYGALSRLDDRTRDIISRKYFFEKSIREIAAEKNMNESTVSTIHNRGLKQLRKIMNGFEL
ncbi:MAG: sigma-70 family RNA polymerase sigma factor [Oscillospiraceae bacterium]|nr:sigma-70 family RNA polymerase sigma factor [Oscillospiraceae bacterium]